LHLVPLVCPDDLHIAAFPLVEIDAIGGVGNRQRRQLAEVAEDVGKAVPARVLARQPAERSHRPVQPGAYGARHQRTPRALGARNRSSRSVMVARLTRPPPNCAQDIRDSPPSCCRPLKSRVGIGEHLPPQGGPLVLGQRRQIPAAHKLDCIIVRKGPFRAVEETHPHAKSENGMRVQHGAALLGLRVPQRPHQHHVPAHQLPRQLHHVPRLGSEPICFARFKSRLLLLLLLARDFEVGGVVVHGLRLRCVLVDLLR